MRKSLLVSLGLGMVVAASSWAADTNADSHAQPVLNFGRPATQADIAPVDIEVSPNGVGLPPGHGTVVQGAAIYAAQCSGCHGTQGQGFHSNSNGGGLFPPLVGGRGTLTSARPQKTVGSYWPYATTLFDYIRRAMPFPKPQSLTPDQVYALTAFILWKNDIVKQNVTMDKATLLSVHMPNADGFYPNIDKGPSFRVSPPPISSAARSAPSAANKRLPMGPGS